MCRLPVAKNHNFGQTFDIFGGSCTDPFYRSGPNLMCYSRPTVYAYLPNFISVYSVVLWWRKPTIFAIFELRHLVMSSIGIDLRKLSTCAQLQTKTQRKTNPKSEVTHSPIQRHQRGFCTPTPSWRNRAHKLWRSKAWRTDRQTSGYATCFTAGGAIGIVHYDVIDDVVTRKL